MLVTAGKPVPPAEWTRELKWDGIRLQARYADGWLSLRSRPGRDCTSHFPQLADLGKALSGREVVLDGELVCLAPDGTPDFSRLSRRLVAREEQAIERAARATPATLMLFDVLYLDGSSTRRLPYRDRRELLDALDLHDAHWRTPPGFADLRALLEMTSSTGSRASSRRN